MINTNKPRPGKRTVIEYVYSKFQVSLRIHAVSPEPI